MKIAISAGEYSADIHGANLVNEIKKINPEIAFFGFGGNNMAKAGVDIEYDLTKLAIIGFIEPIKKYFFLKKLLFKFVKRIKKEKPDLLILIDYPGFNLRLAKEIYKLKVPVFYYIAPQVWAWGESRLKKIKKYIKKIVSILPFEENIYKESGIDCEFVGHPVLDIVKPTMTKENFIEESGLDSSIKTIGIFPGSREQEVNRLLPLMIEIIKGIKNRIQGTVAENVQFVIALSPSIHLRVNDLEEPGIKIIRGKQYDVMNISDLIIAASGTVSLEACLIEVPMIILYKLSWISFILARVLAKVKYISLVNIIENKRIIPEFVQNFKINDIIEKSIKLLYDEKSREQMKLDFRNVAKKLGNPGVSERVAKITLNKI